MSLYNILLLIVNSILVFIVVLILYWLLKEYKTNKLNLRLSKYAINYEEEKLSLSDSFIKSLMDNLELIRKKLSKYKKICEYSTKYEKYTKQNSEFKPLDFITIKIFISIIFLLVFLITFGNTKGILLKLIIGLILGFYIPDIYLLSKRNIIKIKLENELLNAITIMNNSFKSGRSIMQTIKVCSNELEEPLKNEFVLMLNDLEFGLTIEEVFIRLENRVPLDDIKYISTTLSILNKTGGNVIKVFSSIEKTFFNNKKLKDELRNLTSSSKFLFRVLIILPLVFVLTIYLLDNTYFNPLFNNPIGIFVLLLILVLYISYIFVIKNIIKIKE